MFTPYEELEQLAEYLPEEGESLLVSRKDGELVCQPWQGDTLRDGVDDAALYGLLVEANERLNSLAALPLWATGVGTFWAYVGMYLAGWLEWGTWYLVPGLGLVALWGCFLWIRVRQLRAFRRLVRPTIERALRDRGVEVYPLIAGIRQHSELRTLLDEFVHDAPKEAPARARHRT